MSIATSKEVDGVLMERIRSGDGEALGIIVKRHWSPLVAYSARMVGSVDVAEEVAQETFVRLWEGRGRWNPGGSVQGFLFRTARNLALAVVRHLEVRRRTEPAIRHALEGHTPSPLQHVVDRELQDAVRVALSRLPPKRQQAIELVRLRGMSLDEAAEVMGLSRQTVANYISLGLSDLAAVLKDFDD